MNPGTSQLPAAVPVDVKPIKRSRAKVNAYTRLANAFRDEDLPGLAHDCLEAADRRLRHVVANEVDISETPNKRQRCAFSEPPAVCSIEKLPKELLILIMQYAASPVYLGSTCRAWRQIVMNEPSLWRHVTLDPGLSELQCVAALKQYTLRSKASMESVELPKSIEQSEGYAIQAVLLKNAATLRHIKVPAYYQQFYYRDLYRMCPNLKHLDIDDGKRYLHERDIDQGRFFYWERLFVQDEDTCPFALEVFKGSQGITYGPYLPYMGKLKIIHRLDSHRWGSSQGRTFRDALMKINDRLEELILFRPRKFGDTLAELYNPRLLPNINSQPSKVVEFSRLTYLQGWNTVFSPSFSFPALEEAIELTHDRTEGPWSPRSGTLFFKESPRLRKVDFDVSACETGHLTELIEALSWLDLLEDLTLLLHVDRRRSEATFENILAPRKSQSQGAPDRVPCPRLKRLRILYKYQSVDAMIHVLASRKMLAVGYVFGDLQGSVQATSKTWSSCKDTSIAEEPSALSGYHAQSAALPAISRLESIELCKSHTPDGAVDLLHQFADEVVFSDRTFKRFR